MESRSVSILLAMNHWDLILKETVKLNVNRGRTAGIVCTQINDTDVLDL